MPRRFKGRSSVLDRATVGRIAASLSTEELPMARRNSMRERIAARVSAIKSSAGNESSVGWQTFWPNVWVKVLRQDLHDSKQTALLRVLPGGVVPAAANARDQECLVLQGEVFIGEQRVTRGDLHVAAPAAAHGAITTQTGAVLMVRSGTPLQRKGPYRVAS